MASFFTLKAPTQTTKLIPNGGLGGFVSPRVECHEQANDILNMRPRRKLHSLPPPLRISNSCEESTRSPAQFSAASSLRLGGLWTPKTPVYRWHHSLPGSCDVEVVESPTSMRFGPAEPNKAPISPPETPITPRQSSLSELPGSLLLPSQGFPQTWPISPPPSLHFLRRDTAESAVSSVTSLCTSVSAEEGTMETLRHLTSRKHDRSRSDMPASSSGSRGHPAITKPLTTMNIDELLSALPACCGDTATITKHWLPAMHHHMGKLRNILNEAADLRAESSADQTTLSNALTSFGSQLRTVTTEYRRVVKQAEALAERDSKAENGRVKGLESQIDETLEMLEAKDKELTALEETNSELRSTIQASTHVMISFIDSYIPDWNKHANNDPRVQRILRIIADYAQNDNPAAIDYVRVPEGTLNLNAARLRDAESLTAECQKLIRTQSATIKDQGQTADAQVARYAKAVKLVQEKDHEIVLLVEQNNKLSKQLQDNQHDLAQGRAYAEEVDTAGRRYEELRDNWETWKAAQELELEQKDAEIANLRQKLGSAREEIFARREDVRNVTAQNHTLVRAQQDLQASTAKGNKNSKTSRFLRMEKDKHKKGSIPSSHSTAGLTYYDTGYSSKELAPAVSKDVLRHRSSFQTPANTRSAQPVPSSSANDSISASPEWATPERSRRLGQAMPSTLLSSVNRSDWAGPETRTQSVSFALPPPRPSPSAPPRSDSLGYSSNPTSPIAAGITDKPLPDFPLSRSQLATAKLAGLTGDLDSPLQAQIASDYLSHGIMGQTSQSARRVLSRITEVSDTMSHRSKDEDEAAKLEREGEDNGSDHSVASSDREVYRKSISALDMLNSSTGLPCSETETEFGHIMRGTGTDERTPPVVSPPPRSRSRHPAATYNNAVFTDSQNEEEAQTGVARLLRLRPVHRNIRRAGGTHDGIIEDDELSASSHALEFGVIGQERIHPRIQHSRESSGDSIQERRLGNRARQSCASNASSGGYRTDESEPKTVSQMYHMDGKHIRG